MNSYFRLKIMAFASILSIFTTQSLAMPTMNSIAKAQRKVSSLVYNIAKVPRDHGPSSRKVISYQTTQKPGTIIISNKARRLLFILPNGQAEQYKISVGREGFIWRGTTRVGRKAEWPVWRPPNEMRKRDPDLPSMVPAGPFNPLGARAIYLFKKNKDTLFRIHGTNNSASIGGFETSGCFRLSNRDVLDLYGKIRIGSKVIVTD